jgi:hypothetical protein
MASMNIEVFCYVTSREIVFVNVMTALLVCISDRDSPRLLIWLHLHVKF